jgi:hypothetical protein
MLKMELNRRHGRRCVLQGNRRNTAIRAQGIESRAYPALAAEATRTVNPDVFSHDAAPLVQLHVLGQLQSFISKGSKGIRVTLNLTFGALEITVPDS